MGNVLYGDLGSEHLVSPVGQECVNVISAMYKGTDSIMAGYIPCGLRKALWFYSEKYNSRDGGYLSGTLQDMIDYPANEFNSLTFSTVDEFEHENSVGSKKLISKKTIEISNTEAQKIMAQLVSALERKNTVWLSAEWLSSSSMEFLERSLNLCGKIVSVLPKEIQRYVSYVCHALYPFKNSIAINLVVLPYNYREKYQKKRFRTFSNEVINCENVDTNYRTRSTYVAYLANDLCGNVSQEQKKEIEQLFSASVTVKQKDLKDGIPMRAYESLFNLYTKLKDGADKSDIERILKNLNMYSCVSLDFLKKLYPEQLGREKELQKNYKIGADNSSTMEKNNPVSSLTNVSNEQPIFQLANQVQARLFQNQQKAFEDMLQKQEAKMQQQMEEQQKSHKKEIEELKRQNGKNNNNQSFSEVRERDGIWWKPVREINCSTENPVDAIGKKSLEALDKLKEYAITQIDNIGKDSRTSGIMDSLSTDNIDVDSILNKEKNSNSANVSKDNNSVSYVELSSQSNAKISYPENVEELSTEVTEKYRFGNINNTNLRISISLAEFKDIFTSKYNRNLQFGGLRKAYREMKDYPLDRQFEIDGKCVVFMHSAVQDTWDECEKNLKEDLTNIGNKDHIFNGVIFSTGFLYYKQISRVWFKPKSLDDYYYIKCPYVDSSKHSLKYTYLRNDHFNYISALSIAYIFDRFDLLGKQTPPPESSEIYDELFKKLKYIGLSHKNNNSAYIKTLLSENGDPQLLYVLLYNCFYLRNCLSLKYCGEDYTNKIFKDFNQKKETPEKKYNVDEKLSILIELISRIEERNKNFDYDCIYLKANIKNSLRPLY